MEFQSILFMGLIAICLGAITGILAGVFGVGGGALLVPILYQVFGMVGMQEEVQMPMAVGTSLAIIIPTSIRSLTAHRQRGAVDESVLRQWAIPAILGVLIGSFIARFAPPEVFKFVFVGVASVSAVRLLFGRDNLVIATQLPNRIWMNLIGLATGLLSSLMGIGGGQISNLVLTLFGKPIHRAVATSAGMGVLISIPGTIGYIYAGWDRAAEFPEIVLLHFPWALGYVSIIGLLIFAPVSMLTAPLGARIAHAPSLHLGEH